MEKQAINFIEETRIKQNLTKKDLSEKAGSTPMTYDRILKGKTSIKAETLEKLLKVLGFKTLIVPKNTIKCLENP